MLRGEPAHPECTEAERVFIAPVVGWLAVSSSTVPTCWRSRDTTDQTAVLWPQGPEVQHLNVLESPKKLLCYYLHTQVMVV